MFEYEQTNQKAYERQIGQMCAHHMIQGMELAKSYFYKVIGLFDTMKHHISIQGNH